MKSKIHEHLKKSITRVSKKSLLFLATVCVTEITANAQITINSSDIVGSGYSLLIAKDTVNTHNAGVAGSNKTWDFSTLAEHTVSTSNFMSPSGLPGTSAFPTANLAFTSDDPDQDSSYIFILKSTSMLQVVGISAIIGNGDTTTTDYIIDIVSFPSSMGTTFTSTNGGMVLFKDTFNIDPDDAGPHPVVDSIKLVRESMVVSEIDAWGTVTTPLGAFSVLRQDKSETNTDTMFMKTNGTWKIISPELAGFGIDSVTVSTSYSMDW